MMMKELDNRLAVVQFGGTEDPDLKRMAETAYVHWYVFEEDADKVFEINHLKQHYDFVFICLKGKQEEKELKRKPREMTMGEVVAVLGKAAEQVGLSMKEVVEVMENWR